MKRQGSDASDLEVRIVVQSALLLLAVLCLIMLYQL